MKAFDFLSAICELGIYNVDPATFGGSLLFGTIPNGSDMAAVWGDAACVQTENQFIFIYEME